MFPKQPGSRAGPAFVKCIAIAVMALPAVAAHPGDQPDPGEIPVVEVSPFQIDGEHAALEPPGFPLWDISRVTLDGRHLVALGPADSGDRAIAVAWSLEQDGRPIVARLEFPLDLATPGLYFTEPNRLVRPAWSAQLLDGSLVLHMPRDYMEWSGGLDGKPPSGVSLVPEAPKVDDTPHYRPPDAPSQTNGNVILESHVGQGYEMPIDRRLSVLIPSVTRAPADDPDGPPFRYHWQAIHKVFKPVHGESYSVWLCADLETLAINVRMEVMAIFRTERSQRNRPKQSRFLIWDIEQAKVRHEYLIAEDYREQTTFVTFPLGGSPDGSIVVFRAAQALTSDPAEEIGVFITRTSEPWGAVFVKTPMVVHDVAWTDAGRATLVLSNRTAASNERWVRPVEAAPGVPTLDVDAALASEAVHDLP